MRPTVIRFRWRHTVVGLPILLLLAGCATGTDGRKRYGLEFYDAIEAIRRGEGKQALSYYEQAATQGESREQTLDAAKAHYAVSYVAWRLGAYQKALRSGMRSLELFKNEPQTHDTLQRLANLYINLGYLYYNLGQSEEARRYFNEGLELAKGFFGGKAIWLGVLWTGVGMVDYSLGDYKAALRHAETSVGLLDGYLAALFLADQDRRNARRHLAWALWLTGATHLKLRNFAEAEAALQRALSIAKSETLEELQQAATSLLAAVALARGDYPKALNLYQASHVLATHLNATPSLVFVTAGIGRAYAGQGRLGDARASLQQSVELLEALRSHLHEAALRSGFVEGKQEIYHDLIRVALALGDGEAAFGYAERARARAFLDLLGTQTALSKSRTPALMQEELRLRSDLAQAEATAQAELGPEGRVRARQQLEASQRAYRAFLDRVRKEDREQVSLMTVEPVTVPEVQGLLPEGTALLEYLVTEQETVLWVIGPGRSEVFRLPVPRSTLDAEVRALRQAIEGKALLLEVEARARALYDRLFASARPHIRGDRLLIVPHDALHYLPFGALRTPEGRWLIEEYLISTLPSASVLKFLPEKEARAAAGALALGNPDVGPALNLRFAEREARAVGERFPGTTVLVRQEATEVKAKALSGNAGILHFATHGELSEKDPLSSALLLVPDGREDGRLEVREIFGMDLNARLVVLSACETGLGKLSKGDELVGLQRAFLYAGTPAVVTTLWKVDDRASF